MASYRLTDPNGQNFDALTSIASEQSALKKVGNYKGNGAEVAAYDAASKQLFVVSGNTSLQVLDLSNPANPKLIRDLDVSAYGGAANSVAVQNGLIAIAVEAKIKTDPGKVVFFDATGGFKGAVTVGALPDMLTFSKDGKTVLVANEGEPSSYNQTASIDPVGSISLIDISNGTAAATVRTAGFEGFNSSIEDLRAKGVRIYGPNATVAQDLEPEYITVSEDNKTAWVSLQENNAIATVDLISGKVTEIKSLGLKDFSKGTPTITNYTFTDLPVLGQTAGINPTNAAQTVTPQSIKLGGFSGLFYEGTAANGNLKFITHTDRGPNGEPVDLLKDVPGLERPFALPQFQPELVRFELDKTTGKLNITQRIGLTDNTGNALTGLPNVQASASGLAYSDEVAVDLFGNRLSNDKLGADLEGIVVASDGTFWMVDEYRPAIYHFDANGKLIDRIIPKGTATGDGSFGIPALPEVYAQRRGNRGFEGVALEGNKLYAFIQSALDNPDTAGDTTSRGSRNLRIVEFDITTKTVTAEYGYLLDSISASGTSRTDKIGDAVSLGNGKFLVVERDDRGTASSNKLVYEIDLSGATNLQKATIPTGQTYEQLSLPGGAVTPVTKRLVTNAAAIGYTGVEKLEGLALVDKNTIAVINDNDFGVALSSVLGDGKLTPGPTDVVTKLGLIEFKGANGLDPSDRDGGIKISNQPVFGLYQPDAIASLVANGQTYILTANEGDARDYTGYNEELRVGSKDYKLDATKFPTLTTLKTDANLGRLTVTTASGDTDNDGDFDRIETFGARSFSVRDAQGNLVFDSGSQLERIIAAATPTFFNADSGDTTRVDTRSDNKGPEPEGLTLGKVGDRTYAFVGLERAGGGIMVYEVTNPTKPVFIEYVITPGDVSPEGIAFIAGDQSPNGKSLLVVTNELSFTTAIFEFTPPTRISDIQGAAHRSPLEGKTVNNVSGIVTAVRSNGFYLQDPNPDANAATSEAIFVFTSSRPTVKVGDSVLTNGIVGEFRPGNNAGNLSTTQIGGAGRPAATFTIVSSGNVLPDATILGQGGRSIPNQLISDDAFKGNVENAGTIFDPTNDGIDFYESLEGMRLQVNNAQVVRATNEFGEIWVVSDNGKTATGINDRGGITIGKNDFNPERIQIDDDLLGAVRSPQANVGDKITSITGVLDYNFNNYELLATTAFTVKAGTTKPEVTTLVGTANQITVATFNVENLDPKKEDINKVTGKLASNVDDDIASGRFATIAQQIINNLKSPDIVALQEIQDSDGAEISAIVDAQLTAQTLIDAIVAAGGPRYEYRDLAPIYDQDGGQPGGNIRPGFLFNPDRVNFREGSLTRLTDNNLTDGDAFANSRKPLVGEFIFNGQSVTIVNNHFNSKGGDQALFGPNQPALLSSETQRLQQAAIVNQYVTGLLTKDANRNVMVVGDLNDFQFSAPLETLSGSVLTNLAATKLPAADQYTYIFQGNSQMLDHILVSNALKNAEVDIVHINAEFTNQVTDHDPTIARLSLNRTVNTIVGTNGNDNLYGDGKSRIFYGLDGDDNLYSNGGESIQFGGRGNDGLYGSWQADYLDGGDGSDHLYGNGGNDVFVGGLGNDKLYGGWGNDHFEGGDGDDILYGNGGNDRFFGGSGKDSIYVGSGQNTIDAGAGDDTIWLNSGNDTIALARGNGRDTVNNFQAGRTKFTLSAGLSFGDLSFTASNGATLIQAGTEVLASVSWASLNTLNRSANFL